MSTRILFVMAGVLIALGAGGGAAASGAPGKIQAMEQERSAALSALARERAGYPRHFERAYERFPEIPRGLLEAIAYAETGWIHVAPDPSEQPEHRHMPASYGVMGLYRGEGFDNQVRQGAKLLGVDEEQVMEDPATNILAAAALLDQAAWRVRGARDRLARADAGMEAMSDALARYAGYGPGDGNIQSHARQSFAYEVLQALSTGVDEHGVRVPALPIQMEQAFPEQNLRLLSAPALELDHSADTVRPTDDPVGPAPKPRQAPAAGPEMGTAAVDFGEALWNPAHTSNYSTAGNTMTGVIMHTVEGTYAGTISWFQNPTPPNVSAHYVIRRSDGQITQMVREHQTAWHAYAHNHYTIGIEHDGYASDPNNWSAAMLNASARLTRSICDRRAVDCASAWQGPGYDYWHVVPDNVRIKAHGMLTHNQNRYDPGRYFPWATFYEMINHGAPPPVTAPTYWVDTWAAAPGFPSPTGGTQSGTLHQGTHYVYCKSWGRRQGTDSQFNHWWMKTDLDVGPANQWVSAYYLGRWGNDEARDNDGFDLPRCEVLPYGEIGRKYYAMGGVRSDLGVPVLEEDDAQDGGRWQQFDGGMVLWHERTGAHAVWGQILEHFRATGAEGRWGFAMIDELDAAVSPASGQRGRFQYFEDGLFLWSPATGAYAVHGAILAHFENNGREEAFGYPVADEEAHGADGRKQQFELRTLYWTPADGVWAD